MYLATCLVVSFILLYLIAVNGVAGMLIEQLCILYRSLVVCLFISRSCAISACSDLRPLCHVSVCVAAIIALI